MSASPSPRATVPKPGNYASAYALLISFRPNPSGIFTAIFERNLRGELEAATVRNAAFGRQTVAAFGNDPVHCDGRPNTDLSRQFSDERASNSHNGALTAVYVPMPPL